MTMCDIADWGAVASKQAHQRVQTERMRAECFWPFEATDLRAAAVLAAIEVAIIAEQFASARAS